MAWMGHNRFEIDDHVITTKVVMTGAMTLRPGSVGIVSALGEGGNFEVKFALKGDQIRLVTLHESMLRLWEGEPEPEADEADFGPSRSALLDEIGRLLDESQETAHNSSKAMRALMAADVKARLDGNDALHRIADALERGNR